MFLSRAPCRSPDLSPLVVYSAFLPSEFFPDSVILRLTIIPPPNVATPPGLMQMMVVVMVMNEQGRGT